MSGQLLPPLDLAHGDVSGLTVEQRAAMWFDLLSAGHKLVLSGLRQEYGSEEAVRTAYRAWSAEQMAAHDRTIESMLRRMQQRRTSDAC